MKLEKLRRDCKAGLLFTLFLIVASVGMVYGETIADLNAQIAREGLLWRAGETSVSRMSPEEQQALLGGLPTPLEEIDPAQIWKPDKAVINEVPVEYDLRDLNLVSPVKDQERCGSCWAFAAVANLESLALQAGKESALSEQALLDCSWGNCNVGWYLAPTFNFLMLYGTASQSDYPYTGRKETCQDYTVAAKLASWVWINPMSRPTNRSDNKIKSFIYTYNKPVSCYMEVYPSFSYYNSGVYQHLRGEAVSGGHFVLIVGWGQENGVNYWIAKNSWGTLWGMDGYFYIKMKDSNIGTIAIGATIE